MYFIVVSIAKLAMADVIQPVAVRKLRPLVLPFVAPLVMLASLGWASASMSFWAVMGVIFVRDVMLSFQETSLSLLMARVEPYTRNFAASWFYGPVQGGAELLGSALLFAISRATSGQQATLAAIGALVTALLAGQMAATARATRTIEP
jgi:hypothetical protein